MAIIEKLPKLILTVAILIAVVRARPGDLPEMVKSVTESHVFCLAGWIVAGVVIVVAIGSVAIYLRIKPKRKK